MTDDENIKAVITAEDFKKRFNLKNIGFPEPTVFSNAVGISVKKVYPDEHASMYGVEISRRRPQTTPLLSLDAHVVYGKDTKDGVTLMMDKKLSEPIDLDFTDEFSFDTSTGKFYHRGRQIEPEEIFSIMDTAHKKPTKLTAGLLLRIRLWIWRILIPHTIKYLDLFLIKALWIISGEKIKGNIWRRVVNIYSRIKSQIEEDQDFVKSKPMDFFGYEAKRWSVVFYCSLHLAIFSFFYWKGIKYTFVTQILDNNFLALCYVVVSFAFTESWLPRRIKSIINEITPRVFSNISNRKISVS